MTTTQLTNAQELLSDIDKLKKLISKGGNIMHLVGSGQQYSEAYQVDSFTNSATHEAIIDALNDRLKKLESEFERM